MSFKVELWRAQEKCSDRAKEHVPLNPFRQSVTVLIIRDIAIFLLTTNTHPSHYIPIPTAETAAKGEGRGIAEAVLRFRIQSSAINFL